ADRQAPPHHPLLRRVGALAAGGALGGLARGDARASGVLPRPAAAARRRDRPAPRAGGAGRAPPAARGSAGAGGAGAPAGAGGAPAGAGDGGGGDGGDDGRRAPALRAVPLVPGDAGKQRAVRGPLRDGAGHHQGVQRPRGGGDPGLGDPADGDDRHLRGAGRDRGGSGGRHPGGGRLQPVHPGAEDAGDAGAGAGARPGRGGEEPADGGGGGASGARRGRGIDVAAAFDQDDDDEITGINVTPLVDIVLVLLIIFMVTANFIVRETMEVDLPRAANAGATVQGLVNVVMDRNGTLYVDGAVTDEAGLRAKVA